MQASFKNKYEKYADRAECSEQIKKINKMFENNDLVNISAEIDKLDAVIRKTNNKSEPEIVELTVEEEYPVPEKSKKIPVIGGDRSQDYYFMFIVIILLFVFGNICNLFFTAERKDFNVYI